MKKEIEVNTPHTAETERPITLTITVQAEDSADSNYAVVYLTVIPEVTLTLSHLYTRNTGLCCSNLDI